MTQGSPTPPRAAWQTGREWPAAYLDGQTATRQAVTIRIMREGLEVAAIGSTRLWPYREIRQTQGFYAGEEVRLERGAEPSEALLVEDVDFLRSLREAAPEIGARFHDPEKRQRRIRFTVLAAVAVVGFAGALYLWGIPGLAAIAAPRVPVKWEERLGRSMVGYLAPADQICHDPGAERVLASIAARLASTVPRSPYAFHVIVVDQPQVNALAAPGGYIVVYRGLIERARSPEELAGVLAHEMQHVLHRHSTQALIQHTSTGLLVAALTGDMAGPLVYGLAAARVLGQLQYSRHAEAEADDAGMRMLLAARVDPAGMVGFFDELTKGEGQTRTVLSYLSTHPTTADRIARLRALAAGAIGPPVPILSASDWEELKRICSGRGR